MENALQLQKKLQLQRKVVEKFKFHKKCRFRFLTAGGSNPPCRSHFLREQWHKRTQELAFWKPVCLWLNKSNKFHILTKGLIFIFLKIMR